MSRTHKKMTAGILAGALVISGFSFCVSAGPNSEVMPAAGAARALNEGMSVTAIRAEKIRSTGQVDASYVAAVTMAAAEATEKSNAENSTEEEGVIEIPDGNESDSKSDKKKEAAKKDNSSASTEVPVAGAGNYGTEIGGDHGSSSKAAVLAEVEAPEGEEEVPSEERQDESREEIPSLTAGAATAEEKNSGSSEEEDDGMDLVKAVTEAENSEEEDFSDLVIARVDNYVNVRTEPSEDSEVAGKLYDKSVGDRLETEGDWIKIKSGNTEGYVKSEFVVTDEEAKELAKKVGTRTAKVTTTTLYVRQGPSRESDVLGMVPMDDCLTVLEETDDGWAKVSIEEGDGYVSTEFVHLYTEFVRAESKAEEEARLAREEAEREAARRAAEEAERREAAKNSKNSKNSKNGKNGKGGSSSGSGKSGSSSGSGKGGGSYSGGGGSGNGSAVARYALQFVGNPYVYGGTSLTNGADCSGFVMSVYKNFGISLPHSSGGDRGVGAAVQGGLANAQAGDIVCYSGHVGIYIGNGQIVHASTRKTGIKVSNANYRTPVAVRRMC